MTFSMSLILNLMSYLEEALATSSPAKFFIINSVSCPLCSGGGGNVRHGGGPGWYGGGTGMGILVLLANGLGRISFSFFVVGEKFTLFVLGPELLAT